MSNEREAALESWYSGRSRVISSYRESFVEGWQAGAAYQREQLAERDATIERLEAGIPRLQEQAYQMRKQRDRLARLLSFVRDHVVNARHDVEVRSMNGNEASTLVLAGIDQWLADIETAMVEVNK